MVILRCFFLTTLLCSAAVSAASPILTASPTNHGSYDGSIGGVDFNAAIATGAFVPKPLFSKSDIARAFLNKISNSVSPRAIFNKVSNSNVPKTVVNKVSSGWAVAKYPVFAYAGAVTLLHTLKAEVSSYSRWIFGAVAAGAVFGAYQGPKDLKARQQALNDSEKIQALKKELSDLSKAGKTLDSLQLHIDILSQDYKNIAQNRNQAQDLLVKTRDQFKQLSIAKLPARIEASHYSMELLMSNARHASPDQIEIIKKRIELAHTSNTDDVQYLYNLPQEVTSKVFGAKDMREEIARLKDLLLQQKKYGSLLGDYIFEAKRKEVWQEARNSERLRNQSMVSRFLVPASIARLSSASRSGSVGPVAGFIESELIALSSPETISPRSPQSPQAATAFAQNVVIAPVVVRAPEGTLTASLRSPQPGVLHQVGLGRYMAQQKRALTQ